MNQDTILLCAGAPVIKGLGNNFAVSNAMIPVNGKPVLGRILDDLLQKGIDSVIIVHQAADFHLSNFIHIAYKDRLSIKQVPLLSDGNIVESLRKGLEVSEAKSIRVILGDTLITDPLEVDQKDYLYIHPVKNASRWCIAQTNEAGFIVSFFNKQENLNSGLLAVCGHYFFNDAELLKIAVNNTASKNLFNISDVLTLYNQEKPIFALPAKNWFDFGNIDTFFTSKTKLLTGRYFNQLEIDPVLNTITKVSLFNEKLKNELDWYLLIPEELKVLTPRIIDKEIKNSKVKIVQEYYGYPTLAEIFLYYNLHPDVWSFILNNLFLIHERIKSYKSTLSKKAISSVYVDKTKERFETLVKDAYWKNLFEKETIIVNGIELKNIKLLQDFLFNEAEALSEHAEVTIIHGDFCFSNILFDLSTLITRIIDPRGSFGEVGIYGDARYDIAKLRHSVCGLYDFLIADLFDLNEFTPGKFTLKIYKPEESKKISAEFDRILSERGYNLREIKLIESLLFLSMLPLHKENPKRQKAMFLRGISLLNELEKENIVNYENSNRP